MHQIISAYWHAKRSVILIDRLGPEILSTLRIKGDILHRFGGNSPQFSESPDGQADARNVSTRISLRWPIYL